jgi:hypothetical protein
MNNLYQKQPGIRQASSTPSLDYVACGAGVDSPAIDALVGAFTSGSAGGWWPALGSALAAASDFIFDSAGASGFAPGWAGAVAFGLPFASLIGPIM